MTTATAPRARARKPPDVPTDAATQYARDVVDGRIIAGRLVKLAAQRHLRDLVDGPARGLRWDPEEVEDQRLYFAGLRHSKGREWAGQPIDLQPWQLFCQGSLYAWKRWNASLRRWVRRYRNGLIEIAKKNTKSTISSGNGNYLAFDDGEPGSEVYSVATKLAQSMIIFGAARRMVMSAPSLNQRVTVLTENMSDQATNSKFEPLGSDSGKLDGLDAHGILWDELHALKDRALWDVLVFAGAARTQPMQLVTTTAGADRESVCWEQHEHAVQVLEGVLDDDELFAYIATLDACDACRATGVSTPTDGCPDCDDWRDESVWLKSNPSLGVSVQLDMLRRDAKRAQESPTARYAFLRYRMNMWTVSETAWFTPDQWAMGNTPVIPENLRGRPCVAGLDLASTTDLAALVLIFPDEEFFVERSPNQGGDHVTDDGPLPAPEILGVTGGVDILAFFWCPADGIRKRSAVDRVPYDTWRQQGFIEATPGNRIDYRYIRRRIKALAEEFSIAEICYDPAFATQLAQQLQDEDSLTVVPVGQGFASINEPCMLAEMLIEGNAVRHGGNPVMAYCVANVVKLTDSGGRTRPDKSHDRRRIDGFSALVTGLKRIIAAKGHASVYATRGIRSIGE